MPGAFAAGAIAGPIAKIVVAAAVGIGTTTVATTSYIFYRGYRYFYPAKDEKVEEIIEDVKIANATLKQENQTLKSTVKELHTTVEQMPAAVQKIVTMQSHHLRVIGKSTEKLEAAHLHLAEDAKSLELVTDNQAQVVQELTVVSQRLENVHREKQEALKLKIDLEESLRINEVFAARIDKLEAEKADLQRKLHAANLQIEKLTINP